MEVIANVFELRAAVTNAFGEKSFIETLERRGMYRSRIASVVDTDWSTEDGQLIAHHWTVDPEPIVEKFNFPPSWSGPPVRPRRFGLFHWYCCHRTSIEEMLLR